MLTIDQEFKVAFLAECAERGYTMAETAKVAEELADYLDAVQPDTLQKEAGAIANLINKVIDTGGAMVPLAGAAAAGLPLAAGWGAGQLAAKATDVGDEDIGEMKDREVIEEYRRQAEQIKARQASKATAIKMSPRGRRWA